MNSASDSHDIGQLVRGVLAGNKRSVGRLISRIEDDSGSVEEVMRQIYPHTGRAAVVGVTGPPGSGKSTLVDELVAVIRQSGVRVGVVAVDPNSPFSGGAILGDRIRMMRHASDSQVFIRSMGARGHLGGLAIATFDTILILDAMGAEVVLAETVGVGQSELEIAGAADTTIVVIPPGLGDGVQAIKAGIMEIADIFVVNKADQAQAERTVADIRELLRMDLMARDWLPPIVKTVATERAGIADLWKRVQEHRRYLEESAELEKRRSLRLQREIMEIAERRLRSRILEPRMETDEYSFMLQKAVNREMDPYEIVERIVPGSVVGGR